MKRLIPILLGISGLIASCAPAATHDPAKAALPVTGLDFQISQAMIPLMNEDRLVSFDREVPQSRELEDRLRSELQIGAQVPMEVIIAPKRKDQLLSPVEDLKARVLKAGWMMEVQAAQGANESGVVRRANVERRFVLLSTEQAAMFASASANTNVPAPATAEEIR